MAIDVKLIAATPDASRVVAAAAKLCYSSSRASELFDGLDGEKVKGFLRALRSGGHMSPFEHASFTFAIDGLSRVASHQLVRHRIASFSQQSQRYVAMDDPRVVMPAEVSHSDKAREIFESAARSAHDAYERMIELGVTKEDARFILPHGWETSLVMTMNARELNHFFAVRLCRRAQWEIRALARRMLCLVANEAPELFNPTGPSCLTEGKCHETHNPCGRPYKDRAEMMNIDD